MSADLYPVPEKFAATARIRHDDYERLYADSLRDPDAFWGEAAWLSDATAKLKDIADQHFRRGEYAC